MPSFWPADRIRIKREYRKRRRFLLLSVIAVLVSVAFIIRSTNANPSVENVVRKFFNYRIRLYNAAQNSLECYLKTVNYTFRVIDVEEDIQVKKECGYHNNFFYMKHCTASLFLKYTDWLVVLDADTAVVNPNHCIEEWIDDRVSVILMERFFNGEYSAGNYMVKNTPFGYKFLRSWANYEFLQYDTWHGHDQGGLMLVVLEMLMPDAELEYKACEDYWRVAVNLSTYLRTVTCAREAIGAARFWPGKLRIYHKFHGFVRDGWLTEGVWTTTDFMLHGYKWNLTVGAILSPPFSQDIDPAKCGVGLRGWNWLQSKQVNPEQFRDAILKAEKAYYLRFPNVAKITGFMDAFSVADCYPHCEID